MSKPCILNTTTVVYIGKSGRVVDYYDKNAYIFNREMYEAVLRNLEHKDRYTTMIVWQVLANNAEGFIYHFSESYFMNYLDLVHQEVYRGRQKLIEFGYLVPSKNKAYDYIFYADANGLLWERDKETQKKLRERYDKRVQENARGRERWLAKKKAENEQQNNGNQSDENKKADEE